MNRRHFTRNALLAAGELSLLSSASPASIFSHRKAKSISVHVGKTVEITRAHDRCWFPSLYRFGNKDLIVDMSMHADTTHPDGGFHQGYCISRDNGLTWSERTPVENFGGVWADIPQPKNGVWTITSHVTGKESEQDFLFTRCTLTDTGAGTPNAGLKVDTRNDIKLHLQQATQGVMFTASIIPSRDGGLLTCIYTHTRQDPKYYHVSCARSDDAGLTWREGTVISAVKDDNPFPGMGTEGPCEASMARLADGRLFVIYRTGSDGYMGIAYSSDEGRTWTPPQLIVYKGVEPRVRLLSSGILACSTGRPGPVTMMFSLDGIGKDWSNQTPIFHDMSTRYTEFIEIAPNKLFLVYDSVPYGWKEIPATDTKAFNAIYGTFIDIEVHT
ncbi:MAG: sialidase family protein [Acidobacteriota bacterium]